MRTVRNITVAVSPELYRQTRMLAAEYDSTVTAMVAYLLERMPKALKAARFPVGGPKPAASTPPAPSERQTAPSYVTPPPTESSLSGCTAVNLPIAPSLSMPCEAKTGTLTAPARQ
jgi:hypothetical protein